jgi:hypothetical protein
MIAARETGFLTKTRFLIGRRHTSPEKGRKNVDGNNQHHPKPVVVVPIVRVVPVAKAGGRSIRRIVPRPAPQDDPGRLTQPDGGRG